MPVPTPVPQAGTYRFTIDATQLQRAARLANVVQRSAPLGRIEIIPPHLHYIRTTTDGSFTSASKVELRSWTADTPVRFQIEASVFSKIGDRWNGALSFELDLDEMSLSWSEAGFDGRFCKSVLSAEPRQTDQPNGTAVTLPAADLQEAVGNASIFVGRADKLNRHLNGVQVENGVARGGYSLGLIGFKSPALPTEMKVAIPKRNTGNVTTTLAKISGDLELRATGEMMHLQSAAVDLSWKKDGFRLPRQVPLVLDQQPMTSFITPTAELTRAIMLLSIGIEWVKFRYENRDEVGRLILAGHSVNMQSATPFEAKGETPLTSWMRLEDLPELWPFSVNVKDLLDAVLAVKTERLQLSAVRSGLIVQSEAPSHTMTAYLHGFQPN
jgi:hypothetical protein